MTEAKKSVSLNPKDFVTGGLLDDVTVTWTTCKFSMYDYGGKGTPAPGLIINMSPEGDDAVEQFWSAGKADDWAPSEDGNSLTPVGSATGIRTSTNLYLLIKSLMEAGFPVERLNEGLASTFNGMVAHMVRVPAPKREGLKKEPKRGKDGSEYENKILVVEKIVKLPWEADAAGTGASAESSVTAAPAEDIADKAREILLAVLTKAKDGKVAKKDIPGLIFKEAGTTIPLTTKNQVCALFFKEDFMKESGFTISADGMVSLG